MTARSGLLQSLLLAVILAIGAGILWGFAGLMAGGTVSGLFPGRGAVREQLQILADGTPVLMSRQEDEAPAYHDLRGALIENSDLSFADSVLLRARPHENDFTPLSWQGRIQVIVGVGGFNADTSWYFIHDGVLHGHGYFVGYDPETKLKIGYIGRSGFCRDMPPLAEQFSVNGARMRQREAMTTRDMKTLNPFWDYPLWTVYLLADDGLFEINVNERTAKPLYAAPDVVSFNMTFRDRSVRGGEPHSGPPPVRAILLRKPDRVIAIDLNGREFQSYTVPAEVRDDDLSWYRLPNGRALAITPPSRDFVQELFWIGTARKVVRHETVRLHVVQKAQQPWPVRIADQMATMGVGIPSPGTIAGIFAWKQWRYGSGEERPWPNAYWTALMNGLYDFWPVVPFSLLLSLLCYRRQRKFGLPGTWMWTGFVLLFGLPAYFGYLAHRKWPARLPCPSCGKRVPRDRPACFACGHDFPAPAMKGIEVFG